MSDAIARMAQAFIERYNQQENSRYRFETLRNSMFSLPKYKYPAFEIYQISFLERKALNRLVTDLLVLLRLQKRLIIEVVEPNMESDSFKNIMLSELINMIENIIDPIERDALDKVVCARYLLIDLRNGGCLSLSPRKDFYKIKRLERDRLFENHKQLNRRLGISHKEDSINQELLMAGFPLNHWFEEIWLSYFDESNAIKYMQIW